MFFLIVKTAWDGGGTTQNVFLCVDPRYLIILLIQPSVKSNARTAAHTPNKAITHVSVGHPALQFICSGIFGTAVVSRNLIRCVCSGRFGIAIVFIEVRPSICSRMFGEAMSASSQAILWNS